MAKSKVVKIAVLQKPGKRSGSPLGPNETTKVMGGDLLITNLSSRTLYVDRMTPKKKGKKKNA